MMKTLPLFLLTVSIASAAPLVDPIGSLQLTDGRVLKDAVVRTYDPQASKVLVVTQGKALLLPITLFPAPYADNIRERARHSTADLVQTTPIPPASARPPAPPAPPAPRTAAVVPATPPAAPAPAPAATPSPFDEPADPLVAHMNAAIDHVRRYYKYEHRVGSNAIKVTDSDVVVEETEPVTGWTNRYRTVGKAYVEVYDSVGGSSRYRRSERGYYGSSDRGSFTRRTGRFEVTTEQKPGELIKVIDFTRR